MYQGARFFARRQTSQPTHIWPFHGAPSNPAACAVRSPAPPARPGAQKRALAEAHLIQADAPRMDAVSPASTVRTLDEDDFSPTSTIRSLDHEAATDDETTPNTLRRNDLSFHAAGDSKDWESSIAAMESQSESWQDCCDFLKVPFGPLLHCLSFLDGSGLARLETACPPLLRTRVCESASKATVLAALRRASNKAPAVDTSWKRLAGWIGSPPAWRVLRELHCTTSGSKWNWREGWSSPGDWPDVSKWFGVRCARGVPRCLHAVDATRLQE